MYNRLFLSGMIGFLLLAGCSFPGSASPTSTQLAPVLPKFVLTGTPNQIPVESPTPISTETATPIPPVAPTVCTDLQVTSLIDSLRSAMLNSDGALLSSLISPNSVGVRYFRNGTVVNYSAYQAQFLFETTYEVNWGVAPGSGLDKVGSFHAVIVPDLVKIFNQPYTLHCNEIRHGGASYDVIWPYDKDFYSIYYAGTEQNGGLDWRTWVAGIEYDNSKPYIYALMQFLWEP